MTTDKTLSDNQILQEISKNERILEHPSLGKIRLRFPTLEIQRKIDNLVRTKKKILKETKDEIPDPSAPNGIKYIPAYKSREVLLKEYIDLGWWSKEQEEKLDELSRNQILLMAELELLGFEDENHIYAGINEIRETLLKTVVENAEDKERARTSIVNVTVLGSAPPEEDIKFIKENAPSTDTDELINNIFILNRLFNAYSKLAQNYSELIKLQAEQSSLFADSWQEQLQYFTRLAQVYYCVELADEKAPLWSSILELEEDPNSEKVMWAFNELAMFWQGITDDTREKVNKYSFTVRRNTEPQHSEELPEETKSLNDGNLQDNEQIVSSVVLDTTKT